MRESVRHWVALLKLRDHLLAVSHQIPHPPIRQQLGSTIQFSLHGDEDALHRIPLQVGGDVHAVWQLLEGLEGCATLEVNQHKVDDARIVADRHTRDQRQQQLRFTRASGAGDHTMHPVSIRFGGIHHAAHFFAADQAQRSSQPLLVFGLHTVLPVLGDGEIADAIDPLAQHHGVHVEQGD